MVLIHSRASDRTTVEVIQWLLYYGKEIFRLNNVHDIDTLRTAIENNEINAAYYNGRGLMFNRIKVDDEVVGIQIYDYLKKESAQILYHLLSEAQIRRVFGSIPYDQAIPGKLKQLSLARSLGFEVPRFEIVSRKERLQELKKEWGRIICKATGDGINIESGHVVMHGQKTQEVTGSFIDQVYEEFFPTFIQELIEKEYEVRTFSYHGKSFSLATFSQSNGKSVIDGRVTDTSNPQRQVPYNLPEEIDVKARKLLEALGLNYGSFDFIVSPGDQFYFLEVNPYGQYGYLSHAGNFYIEKEIAEYL